jgi:phage N-6-adenine-methyltransferase
MSVPGFRARNHPAQVARRGAVDAVDDRATAPEVFDPINARFGFTIDVAASPANTKCARYYTRDDNGLQQPWGLERVWCNPPFSGLPWWVSKAREEMDADIPPQLIVMLVPANRTDQDWWHEHIEPYRDLPHTGLRTEFLPGRPRFIQPGDTSIRPGDRPPFGICLLIWHGS